MTEVQEVSVTSGIVTMSELGEFICKGKHWNVHFYKLMSYYSNGWYAIAFEVSKLLN